MKYEITDIVHEAYPFLHRIRALQDVGDQVKAGDLGGFVESESNLETDPSDGAWIFDDAIAAGDAYVDQDSSLRDTAIACDSAMCPTVLSFRIMPVWRTVPIFEEV